MEGREWPQKIFHDQSPQKDIANLGRGWTHDLLVSSQMAHPTEPPRPALLSSKIIVHTLNITQMGQSKYVNLDQTAPKQGVMRVYTVCHSSMTF